MSADSEGRLEAIRADVLGALDGDGELGITLEFGELMQSLRFSLLRDGTSPCGEQNDVASPTSATARTRPKQSDATGVIAALDVRIDTTLVLSLLVPALALELGPKTRWPSKVARAERLDPVTSAEQ